MNQLKRKVRFFCTLSNIIRIFTIIYDVLWHYYEQQCSPESWSSSLISPLAENNWGKKTFQVLRTSDKVEQWLIVGKVRSKIIILFTSNGQRLVSQLYNDVGIVSWYLCCQRFYLTLWPILYIVINLKGSKVIGQLTNKQFHDESCRHIVWSWFWMFNLQSSFSDTVQRDINPKHTANVTQELLKAKKWKTF